MKLFANLIATSGLMALIIGFGFSVNAQDGDTESGAETSAEFPVGTTPEIQLGQPYAKETFGDWEMLCIKTEEGPEPCEIGQLILDGNGNAVSDVRMFPLPPGSEAIAGATFITPLGVALQSGLLFAVDDKKPKQYPFQFCNNIGCVSRIGFTPLELQAMRKGETGIMSFRLVDNPQQPVNVGVSLKGFAAAFAALSKLRIQQGQ